MEKIIIFGSGGFGKEVHWVIDRINHTNPTYEILGYIDDTKPVGEMINQTPVIGDTQFLVNYPEEVCVAIAIGSASARQRVYSKISENKKISFPNLIDPSVLMSDFNKMGIGNIICARNIITVNISIADFVIMNLSCTIGHDTVIDSFVTLYPNVNVSGNVVIGRGTELGTGVKIIQNIEIGANAIVGAGAVIIKSMMGNSTIVGVPAKIVKSGEPDEDAME